MHFDVFSEAASPAPTWKFQLNAGNGSVVAASKPYPKRVSAMKAVESVCIGLNCTSGVEVKVFDETDSATFHYVPNKPRGQTLVQINGKPLPRGQA